MADRWTQDLELGGEEPAHPRRESARRLVGQGTGCKSSQTSLACDASAEDRRHRPLVHHGTALVFALEFCSHRYRHLQTRKSKSRIQTICRGWLDCHACAAALLPECARMEARQSAARGYDSH